jgi:DedD protein
MGLFSLFRKNKQEDTASAPTGFTARAGEDAAASGTRAKRKAARDTDESEIPEKKRARRRLIGAIVLVLVVIIVLPMIFDPEPNPQIDKIAIHIPSREQSVPSPAAAPVVTTEALGPSDAVSEQEFEELVIEEGPASADIAPPVPVIVEKPIATPSPVVKPTPTPTPVAPKVATPKQDEAERALAILEGRTPPAEKKVAEKPAATGGKFVLQVAALASQEKVTELRKKLSDSGIKSFTQKITAQDGERTRIRVGPFASKEEAEKMRARILKLGLNATLVPA